MCQALSWELDKYSLTECSQQHCQVSTILWSSYIRGDEGTEKLRNISTTEKARWTAAELNFEAMW